MRRIPSGFKRGELVLWMAGKGKSTMSRKLPYQLIRTNLSGEYTFRKVSSYKTEKQAIAARDMWQKIYEENGLAPVMDLTIRKKV